MTAAAPKDMQRTRKGWSEEQRGGWSEVRVETSIAAARLHTAAKLGLNSSFLGTAVQDRATAEWFEGSSRVCGLTVMPPYLPPVRKNYFYSLICFKESGELCRSLPMFFKKNLAMQLDLGFPKKPQTRARTTQRKREAL